MTSTGYSADAAPRAHNERQPREDIATTDRPPGGVLRASPYPRPIPGVPLERNLNGISFAVANVTGVFVCNLATHPGVTSAEAAMDLLRGPRRTRDTSRHRDGSRPWRAPASHRAAQSPKLGPRGPMTVPTTPAIGEEVSLPPGPYRVLRADALRDRYYGRPRDGLDSVSSRVRRSDALECQVSRDAIASRKLDAPRPSPRGEGA